ncbi:NADPH-dependent FMN reductase [Plantibacter sp. YIM 135249]|uniref:NADPH-dependent FMN reductase n=1 Tax=Plantibacter sp. YIM 135249 TaxID=3423918 RepID=UPI003D34AA12
MTFTVAGLVGNPRSGSKTHATTVALVDRLVDALAPLGAVRGQVTDLAEFGGRVLDPTDQELAELRTSLTHIRLLVVATPVYKGSYTGLLKAFLDGYGPGALERTATVPLTIAASPQHALAGSTHLHPLLIELGSVSPAGALAIPDAYTADIERRDAVLDAWVADRLPFLAAAAAFGEPAVPAEQRASASAFAPAPAPPPPTPTASAPPTPTAIASASTATSATTTTHTDLDTSGSSND